MEENNITLEQPTEDKSELKLFEKAFSFFILGQIFLIISVFGNVTIINGVPAWLGFLSMFEVLTYIFYLVFIYKLRGFNKSFRKCFFTFLIYFVMFLLVGFGSQSKESFIIASVKGLKYAEIFVRATFYLYFFHGTYLFFEKQGFKTGKKRAKITLIIYISLYTVWVIFDQLSGMRLLLTNYIVNRILFYGKWVLLLAVYGFVFAMVLSAAKYMKKKVKEEDINNGKE